MRATRSNAALSSLIAFSSLSLSNALSVPNNLPGAWKYQGCYTDIAGRTLSSGGYADDKAMTDESCIAYCASKGYQYAGTEYSQECYCGSTLPTAATKLAETECGMACKGNASEPCGSGGKLSLFYSSAPVGPQPNPGVNGWQHIGCYSEGTTGRTLTYGVGSIPGNQMTVALCTQACRANGYILSGLEYGGECYCDNKINNGGAPATDGCNMLCNGNTSEICGGGNRLNVYDYNMLYPVTLSSSTSSTAASSSSSVAPVATSSSASSIQSSTSTSVSSSTTSSSVSSSTSKSSTLSSTTTSTLSTSSTKSSSTSTAQSSSSSISSSSTTLATSTKSTSSSTSSSTSQTSTKSSSVSTSSAVLSTSSSVVSSRSSVLTSSSSSTVAAVPTGPVQPAAIGNFAWYGCQTEATGMRALSAKTYADDTMTLESCMAFCAGYTFFGVEYARECYCGNSFGAGSKVAPSSDCSFTCKGNAFEYCGAGDRLSVYAVNGTALPSSSSTSAAASTGAATSAASSSAVAVPSGLPTGWSYQGCWVDGANGRILNYQAQDNQALTVESCAQLCAANGYTISGTEWSVQCFCGNQIANGGKLAAADTECNVACGGNSKEMCGAGGRMSIISKGTPTVFAAPAPQTGGLNGSWTYQGCVEDNVNQQRTFFWQLFFPKVMTANMCLSRCAQFGYMAAGLEYGEECYCGDPANVAARGATFRPEAECNVPCAGNASAICGGGGRLSTYFWTGKPFYTWDFPAAGTPAAGKYDLLIGGVTIPLMTSESITGKVQFISKWGTGPANETGAYELDLSLLSNPSQAWRPLHLKTDVFCAAGVVLPDKAGRHLNVGGWSGDSTEGLRLYWPDGKPGTWGTHDWQENVDELSLQVGRWYPSAMVMANGSVMVIGGEVGSNAAAVPSIEVLPYTGTKPLYMDWLDRTNPNNLYPFVCVLPGGGIFVAYWNEARILDEKTFATTKVLPNAPGAVNDDLGGRTYPLEGTAVLLPQKAPYTDPLGILICGGSTNGVSNALDNCVTIQPEAATPSWTLERMPSFRVMPCMAPLPDGTYLVANGAQHGVAGFGLANTPNLNALLYDPAKPVGSRFTVMANTTIARLYHSEAITLLDGRVLVSGSDPEDGTNPQEYRVEVFSPPYLLSGKTRPTFTITNKDWAYGNAYTFSYTSAGNGALTVTLLGSVTSTHGNSLGARSIMPAVTCGGGTCTVTAPPNNHICPPGWYQLFLLDGGIPAVGVYVRIGGDPAKLGNWPAGLDDFTVPGV